MNVLFMTNLLPYPLDNGGKIKTYTTLKSLNSSFNSIDLLCFTEDTELKKNEEVIYNFCSTITQIPLKLTTSLNKKYMFIVALRSIFSEYPLSILKYISPKMINLLHELKKNKNYEYIYIDHLQMCVYYDVLKKLWPDAKFILDEHNCEYLIMQRNASTSKNIFKYLFLNLETLKLKKFESKYLTKVDDIIVLSQEDESALKKIAHDNIKTTIIPIGIKSPDAVVKVRNGNLNRIKMLFIGTLSWSPNNDGIIWFIEKVVPLLRKKNIKFKLTVIGKNPSKRLTELCQNDDDIELVGYVNSVIPYYEQCDCMIVPLFVGSGQRVKIIEGFSLGMPIISTTIGAEGLKYREGNNILIADSEQVFVEKIEMIKSEILRKKLSENSRKIFMENYSIDAVKKKICSVVEK